MSKISKYSFLFLFFLFSIYFTNQTILTMRENTPLMKEIKKSKKKYEISSSNAIFQEDEMISGSYGLEVDILKSYQKMNQYGAYNELLTVFTDVKPELSIDDYYDKYLIRGNGLRREIGLVFLVQDSKDLSSLLSLIKEKGIDVTFFIDGCLLENQSFMKKISSYEVELLSYNHSYQDIFFKSSLSYLSTFLERDLKYCFTENDNPTLLDICSHLKLHTVKSKVIHNHLYSYVKNHLEKSMILVVDNYSIDDLSTMIDFVVKKGYSFCNLEELFQEKSNFN